MNHGSLFSGIGGFDLAAQWMDWTNVFHCEKEKFCQQILKYYWPNAELHEDITKTDFTKYKDKIDILSGGFPCQPFSNAGERKGTADDRYLWPEMLRAISEIKPRWIVGENVFGLVNWNEGLVLDTIKADLENLSYEVFPPVIIPACGLNAPHKRYRVWIIAHTIDGGYKTRRKQETEKDRISEVSWSEMVAGQFNGTNFSRSATNTNPQGLQKRIQSGKREDSGTIKAQQGGESSRIYSADTWREFPTQPPICSGNDGFSTRLDGIAFSKWRKESVKAAGNAIVPQIAFEIFKTIEAFEEMRQL